MALAAFTDAKQGNEGSPVAPPRLVPHTWELPDSEFEDEERSRTTMWDVPRFAEYHNYNPRWRP